MSYYGMGDYYAGGDIFGWIKDRVVGAVGGFLSGGPAGAVSGALSGAFGKKKAAAIQPIDVTQVSQPVLTYSSAPTIEPTPGLAGTIQRLVPGGKSGYQLVPGQRRRRMNVANAKALRRAIRREQGFVKLARRALKGTGYKITSRGASSRGSPGVITKAEAARALRR